MQISNHNDFSGTAWEPFNAVKIWQLEPGDGQKTVWARFKNLSGQTSQIISAAIVLDTTPPANVSNFESDGRDGEILLKWKNPSDFDFVKVLIVRRPDFYPLTPDDGRAVYDGRSEAFNDKGLNKGEIYYYTAFSYDDAGNYSSGAVANGCCGKNRRNYDAAKYHNGAASRNIEFSFYRSLILFKAVNCSNKMTGK